MISKPLANIFEKKNSAGNYIFRLRFGLVNSINIFLS